MADNLRERKKAATRRRLQHAALALFAERGFEETTVEDICAAVDVSPRTFHRYFKAKEDVVQADVEDNLERLRRAIAGQPRPLGPREVRAVLLEMAVAFEEMGELRPLIGLGDHPRLRGSLLLAARAWQDLVEGEVKADHPDWPALDIEVKVAATMAAFGVALRRWAAQPVGERPLPQLVAEVLDLVAPAVG